MQVSLVVIVSLYIFYWLVSVGLFIWRRNYEPVQSRGRALALLQGFAMLFHFCLLIFINLYQDPCFVGYFGYSTILPIWSYPYFYRVAFPAWFNYHSHRHKLLFGTNFNSDLSFFYNYRWLISYKFQLGVHAGVTVFMYLVSFFIFFLDQGNPWGNPYTWDRGDLCEGPHWVYFVYFQFFVVFVLSIITVVKLWNVQDPFYLKEELKLALITGLLLFPIWAVSQFKLLPHFKASHSLYIILTILPAITFLFPVVMSFRMNRPIRRSSSAVSIEEREGFHYLFQDDGGLRSFEDFCVSKWCVENLLFYKEVKDFRNCSSEKRVDLAQLIRRQYLQDDSPLLVNIDNNTRQSILRRMDGQEIDRTLFETAEKEIEHSLRYGVYVEWLKTKASASFTSSRNTIKQSRESFRHSIVDMDAIFPLPPPPPLS